MQFVCKQFRFWCVDFDGGQPKKNGERMMNIFKCHCAASAGVSSSVHLNTQVVFKFEIAHALCQLLIKYCHGMFVDIRVRSLSLLPRFASLHARHTIHTSFQSEALACQMNDALTNNNHNIYHSCHYAVGFINFFALTAFVVCVRLK